MASKSNLDLEGVNESITDLRRKMEALMEDRVTPAVGRAADRAQAFVGRAQNVASDYAGQAQDYAHQAQDFARKEADTVASIVKERPFTTIALAAGIGYVLARLLRR
ncbi:hypothetical protein [Roseomonas haemaphysalidis]|jgi:ElaB/YqjD/DUF883 family membrane-anchored ribosome-binding protein|uniref:DUF883 family protein n=1 Tax=Roseomonas haemaphysalidis TaxID=2768162 RepID=A0ABS3KQM9_9PROT|nr:hypothetical protein [Roseomonas haemaphysalidis]MBO1079769.1 hypothetical protein [Roseomonas haemaphysalidis]